MTPSVVVTDLDGTFWDADERIHPRTLEAVSTLAAREIPLLVATGRRASSARRGLARSNLAPPAVVLGGALVIDLSNDDVIARSRFVEADALSVLGAFRDHDLEPCVYVDDPVEVVLGRDPSTHPDHVRGLSGCQLGANLEEVVAEMSVLSFGIVGGDRAHLEKVAITIGGSGAPIVNRDAFAASATLMVAPLGVDKWQGVMAFCRHRNLDETKLLAVGDGENDVELMRRADIAVAAKHGAAATVANADHVIASPESGGWADILELFS